MSIHIIMCLSVCDCFKDRLPDRHSCLNLYPCVIKVQSISQSLSLSLANSNSHLSFFCVILALFVGLEI